MWKRIKGRLFDFGIGLERLLTCMLDLENIIDAMPLPRTIRRFYP